MDFQVSLISLTFLGGASALFLYLLYHLALPKPIAGIPYNEASSRNLLGDVPAMMAHIKQTEGTFTTYIMSTMKSLNAPLVQIFIQPLGKPLLILSDFREANDMLVHRSRDFDRSSSSGDLVRGLGPDHHILKKTNAGWKAQRRLLQDLMTPSFLHNIASPIIYATTSKMIDMWCAKSSIADGRPWSASEDISYASLDALMAFTFGEAASQHSAITPTLEAVQRLDIGAVEALRRTTGRDEPVEFPHGKIDQVLQATLDLTATVADVQGSPLPNLKWAYVLRKPRIKRATKIKEDFIMKELKRAVDALEEGKGAVEKSAVDHMVKREHGLAEKEGRKPNYFSRVMIDEIFGFVFAGHETTSTTTCWGLKFLADDPATQTKLRAALQASFSAAWSEGRNPTIQEINNTHIPYLDASLEEMLRTTGTVPVVDRQAVVDTEILGYKIPKGTVICCLATGPSITGPSFDIDEAQRNASTQASKKEGRDKAWDPEDMSLFKPERWLVKGAKGDEFDPAAGPQMAFGAGIRGCYGKRLAYLDMRILITLIIWRFELLPCPPALSGYKSVLIVTNEPKSCYVSLREINVGGK